MIEKPPHIIDERAARPEDASINRGVIWFTGLSGAGKTTLASAVGNALEGDDSRIYRLDGDVLRAGLCSDLGFSLADRSENVRRVGEVARLFYEAGHLVLVSAISPLRADRDRARSLIPAMRFVEVHCSCPLSTCEARDTKGLYRRARAGELAEFTGISSPYEAPVAPDARVDSSVMSLEQQVSCVLKALERSGMLRAGKHGA